MPYAIYVHFLISSEAPVVILPKKISSDILPPNATVIISHNYLWVYNDTSSGKYYANPNEPFDLGIIVSFNNGAASLENQPATACPASWYATVRLYNSFFGIAFSIPAITLSVANSKSFIETFSLSCLAAIIAASLQIFAISAPENPGVKAANFFA